ncbi:MAG: hypothetical protein ACJ8EL_10570, partial [Rhizomicrobium sp.]
GHKIGTQGLIGRTRSLLVFCERCGNPTLSAILAAKSLIYIRKLLGAATSPQIGTQKWQKSVKILRAGMTQSAIENKFPCVGAWQ